MTKVLPAWDAALSVGDIGDSTDDDFQISFPSDSFHAVGFSLVDNAQDAAESLRVYGRNGLIGVIAGTSIPDSSGDGRTFVGLTAAEPIARVHFDEDAGADDIAIADLRFGCAALDADADGFANMLERVKGTDAGDTDSDDDGLFDGQEVGAGVFGAPSSVAAAVTEVRALDSGDFDGDGDEDVIWGDWESDTIAWSENIDAAGTFGSTHTITTTADGISRARRGGFRRGR